MPARPSARVSVVLAVLAGIGAFGLSLLLRADTLRRDQAYAGRYLAQAKLAGRVRAASPEPPAGALTQRICVADLDTFATAIARRFGAVFGSPAQGTALVA